MLDIRPGEVKTIARKYILSLLELRCMLDEFEAEANQSPEMILCETARHHDNEPHPFLECRLTAECLTDGSITYTAVLYG